MEFLTRSIIRLPHDTPQDQRDILIDQEARIGRALVESGRLRRIWRIPGQWANLALWSAADATDLHDTLLTLPLHPYMTTRVQALAIHPLEAAAAADPSTGKRN